MREEEKTLRTMPVLPVGGIDAAKELARERDPLYNEVADIVIDTGRPNVQSLIHSILVKLGQEDGVQAPGSD